MASINPTSLPLRARTGNGNESLNNSRVINRFAVVGNATKNINSERERLGAFVPPPTASTNYLDNDEEEQDTVSDRGKHVTGSQPVLRDTLSGSSRFLFQLSVMEVKIS
jgi:hypothetical protein